MRLTRRPFLMVLIALSALVMIPIVYLTGAGYVVEEQVWDAAYSTYAYVERPGADAALTATVALCGALAVAAIGALALAVGATGSRYPSTSSGTGPRTVAR